VFADFLQDNLRTQVQREGETAEFHQKEGTAAKSPMLVNIAPDVAKPLIIYDRGQPDVD
jgi:hypothetical protein